MKSVLFLVGSLRKGSFNHQMAQQVEEILKNKATVSYAKLDAIPLFSQDKETPVLPEIANLREQVLKADAVWIFSPIYNFAIPGLLKNALDWLSRALDLTDTKGPSALQDKFVTVSSVAGGGHDRLFQDFNHLLPFIRMQVVGEFTSSGVNPEAWATNQLELSEETRSALEKQAEALLAAIEPAN